MSKSLVYKRGCPEALEEAYGRHEEHVEMLVNPMYLSTIILSTYLLMHFGCTLEL